MHHLHKGSKSPESRESFKKAICGYSWNTYEESRLEAIGLESIERNMALALNFIETQYTAKYGFLTDVASDINLQTATLAIPNIFDTALMTEILLSAGVKLSHVASNSVKNLLLSNRSVDGTWNYFPREYSILPDDIDDSSIAILALSSCGVSKSVTWEMASTVLNNAVFHNDGLVDVYFPKPISSFTSGEDLKTSKIHTINNWPAVRRVDIGVTANFLYLQTKLGNANDHRLTAGFDLIHDALEDMLSIETLKPVLSLYKKHYENLDIICFLISRIIPLSTYANNKFQVKLQSIVKKRLLAENSKCISRACRIMAALNIGLFEDDTNKKLILQETRNLLQSQCTGDFTFPKVGVYNAHKAYHFGSLAMSTAFSVSAVEMVKTKLHSWKKLTDGLQNI